jgi:hypothetical protein
MYRRCEDVGRSVLATGLWCDILCSPYHSFGVTSEDKTLLKVSNKQFKYTAVDISRHNLRHFLCELRGEEQATVADSLEGAKPSRGPTTAEVLSHKLSVFKMALKQLLAPLSLALGDWCTCQHLDRSLRSW